MTRRGRPPLITRGRLIAWGVAVALGVAFGAAASSVLGAFTGQVLGAVVIFAALVGLLAVTGHLVTVMRLLGNPTRAVASAPGELPADVPFGVWLLLFSLATIVGTLL
jgi:uncharacterized protein (DUF58 family)